MSKTTMKCHCGKPLHYTDKTIENRIKSLIHVMGEYIVVTSTRTGKPYKVSRHYIALHGLNGKDLDYLGFEEVE